MEAAGGGVGGGQYGAVASNAPGNVKTQHNEKITKNKVSRFLSKFVGGITRDGSRRRVVNWLPFLWGITVPWILFLSVMSLTCLAYRFQFPNATFTYVCFVFVFMCVMVYYFAKVKGMEELERRKSKRKPGAESLKNDAKPISAFHAHLSVVCCVYILVGYLGGDLLFWTYFLPYFQLKQMASYVDVNPSSIAKPAGLNDNKALALSRPVTGKRYQDAGKIYFDNSASVAIDKSKAMSFKANDMYCVAPIVDKSCKSDCGYDFWAVGINCCGNDDQVNFSCESGSGNSKTAVRWVDNLAKPFFRLAVIEAEGVHSISAKHPIFVKYFADGTDPVVDVNSLGQKGFSMFFSAAIGMFVLNIAVVAGLAKHDFQ